MKYIKTLVVLVLALLVMPSSLFAASTEKIDLSKYKTKNLTETLAAEEMEPEFDNYSEKDDQITIYMFRGDGCGYCRAFLTFLNGITNEYGKYFKLVSFEVWSDSANADLMKKVSTFLGETAQGVPYVIIGEKVFPGYASTYDDSIKAAIEEEYAKSDKERYDVFKAMNDANKATSATSGSTIAIISIINLVIVACACVVVIANQNKKFAELEQLINKSLKKSKE